MGELAGRVSAPERLSPAHQSADFDSGKPLLDDWLKRRALANNGRTSQTFVIHIENSVIGYYSLAAGAVALSDAPLKLKRNSVDPIPIILLGRLAVDKQHHGRGLGADLLRDAMLRSIRIADEIGVRALLTHAIDDAAADFYKRWDFIQSPAEPRTLMLPLDQVARLLR